MNKQPEVTITVTLKGIALNHFHEIMYSLPSEENGTGMCTEGQVINYLLNECALAEKIFGEPISVWAELNYPKEYKEFLKETEVKQ